MADDAKDLESRAAFARKTAMPEYDPIDYYSGRPKFMQQGDRRLALKLRSLEERPQDPKVMKKDFRHMERTASPLRPVDPALRPERPDREIGVFPAQGREPAPLPPVAAANVAVEPAQHGIDPRVLMSAAMRMNPMGAVAFGARAIPNALRDLITEYNPFKFSGQDEMAPTSLGVTRKRN